MKKTRNILGLLLMYLGAWLQGYKYILIAAIVLSVIFTSCGDKDGCGNYGKWESKHSFNK